MFVLGFLEFSPLDNTTDSVLGERAEEEGQVVPPFQQVLIVLAHKVHIQKYIMKKELR